MMKRARISEAVARAALQNEADKLLAEGKIEILKYDDSGEPVYYPKSQDMAEEVQKRLSGALKKSLMKGARKHAK